MQPLSCRLCGTQVMVAKNSLAQTTVQWADSSGCVEFSRHQDVPDCPNAVVPTCFHLRDSIETAVSSGEIVVANP